MAATSPFDLNSAIQEWRENLAQSAAFRDESLNELESHLRNSVDEIAACGFSKEESFIVAAMRLGNRSLLENEYSKVNNNFVWTDRILWMLIGVQAWGLITGVSTVVTRGGLPFVLKSIFLNLPHQTIRAESMTLVYSLVQLGGLMAGIALCWWLIRKNINQMGGWFHALLTRSRSCLMVSCAGLCLVSLILYALCYLPNFFLVKFLGSSNFGENAMFFAYAQHLIMEPIQIVSMLVATLLLARKRLRLRCA